MFGVFLIEAFVLDSCIVLILRGTRPKCGNSDENPAPRLLGHSWVT